MRFVGLVLALILTVGCTGSQVALPTFELPTFELPRIELPSFDTAELERLVDDALAEVDRLGSDIRDELPPDLLALLDQHDIEPPALPSNSNEICAGLGTPGVSTIAGAGLTTLIEALASGTEVGLI